MKIDLIDLFSGMGGFSKGLMEAGFEIENHYFSEIEKHPIANYLYNFPHSKNLGDVRGVNIERFSTRPTFVTFGFPCQDLSIAGGRAGLTGSRSSLFYEAIRVVKEVKPEIFIFENVKGLLTSNGGKDFECVLRAIADLGIYECEWQLVNSKWLLPQNRERVFFIGHLRESSFSRVFPITENDRLLNDCNKSSSSNRIISGCFTSNYYKIPTDGTYLKIRQLNTIKNFGGKSTKQQDKVYDSEGIMGCLTSHNPQGKMNILTRSHGFKKSTKQDYSPTVTSSSFEHNNFVNDGYVLRGLTEIEAERLQGFDDNWTKYGVYDGIVKQIPKSARYKMIGNAITMLMAKVIGQRLLMKQDNGNNREYAHANRRA